MKRRKNGEGTYGKRKINGANYFYFKYPNDGKTIYAKTAKELEEKKRANDNIEKEGTKPEIKLLSPVAIFSELADVWLSTIRSEVAASTYDAYEDIINVRIKKYKGYDLGNKQIQGITINMLESYLNSMKTKYSKASIDKTWVVIKQTLQYGQDKGYVSSDLDLTKVKKPKEKDVVKKKKEVQFATLEDINILYAESNRIKDNNTPVYGDGAKVLSFIMYSGLRISEATALTWEHVAKDYSDIKVYHSNRRVVKRDENGKAIVKDGHKVHEALQKDPKTSSGVRVVPLPDRAIEILHYFNKKFLNHKPTDHVFLTKTKNTFTSRNLQHILQRMMDNSNCSNKKYTPHSLRHGYGSILLSQGVDIKTVSILLGHKDISTTYNIYIHVLDEEKRKAVTNVFNQN